MNTSENNYEWEIINYQNIIDNFDMWIPIHHNDDMKIYDHLIKILIIGDRKVGKTTFIKTYLSNSIITTYKCITVQEFVYKYDNIILTNYTNNKIMLNIYDMSGDKKYMIKSSKYYKDVNIIYLIYVNKNIPMEYINLAIIEENNNYLLVLIKNIENSKLKILNILEVNHGHFQIL